ncbi:BCCT family transporter [Prauserella aidingensis]|uniref:BCCT family transporter n=1 Tax=Prauserella aidingensis TaxID=387890 RepID=UPI0035587F8B
MKEESLVAETSAAEAAPSTSPDDQPAGHKGIAPRVFWPSVIIVLAFVLISVIFPDSVAEIVGNIQDAVIGTFSWYYLLLVSVFVVFAIWIGVSHFGDIKLGPDDEGPEFGLGSWFAMLFAAGMGIGLVFWGVAEPLNHFAGIPNRATGIEEGTEAGAHDSILQTILHWGLHPWAIYVVVGVAIAYAIHRKKRPVSIRWALEGVLGRKVNGWIGDVIDVAAICGTLFGVATSLGLGVMQVAAGLSFIDVIEEPNNLTYVVLIGAITTAAVISVVTGLKKGIKYISNINLGLAAALLLFVLIAGPTLFIFRDAVQSLGDYLQNILQMSVNTTAYSGEDGTAWQGWWTTYYWAWWISWAPFVGVFIARISRGRTVRQFVAGVLLVPTVVAILWFCAMGGTALYRELWGQGGLIGVGEDGAATVDTNTSLFAMLEGLPGGSVVIVGAIILIVLFFVTSSDSGSLVVDMLSSGGDPNPPVWSRVFWGVAEGAVAIALLLPGDGGALDTLKLVAILIALPFSVVMIGMCVSIWREFSAERRAALRAQRRMQREELTEHVTSNLVDAGVVEDPEDGTDDKVKA